MKILVTFVTVVIAFPIVLFLAGVWVDLLIDALDTITYVLERYAT